MAIPKSIKKIVGDSNIFRILDIAYFKHGMSKYTGYIIIDVDHNELLTIAPLGVLDEFKWLVIDRINNTRHNIKSLTELSKLSLELKPGKTDKIYDPRKKRVF